MKTRYRKILLLIAIIVTVVFPLFFVDYNEPSHARVITKLLAKTGSMAGTILLMWQFVLGYRYMSARLCPDLLWNYNLHKWIGIGGVCLIALHPIFIAVYYAQIGEANPWLLELSEQFSWMVLLGIMALSIMAVVVISSTLLRNRLSKHGWYNVHLNTYLVPPLVFTHSLPIGMTLEESVLSYFWLALSAFFGIFVCHRIARALGWRKSRYRVLSTEKKASDTTQIMLDHVSGRPIEPRTGQFVYVNRQNRFGGSRPYTVAHWDPESGRLGVAVKPKGSGSSHIVQAAEGETFLVDGPYGVFLDEALRSTRPVVMIAGGIGITPFLRFSEHLEHNWERRGWLFYGNRLPDEILYKERFNSLESVEVVPVISDDPDYEGEKGFITLDLLKKYLPAPLTQYEFLLCGPPVMIRKVKAALLHDENVPRRQVHDELFEL